MNESRDIELEELSVLGSSSMRRKRLPFPQVARRFLL